MLVDGGGHGCGYARYGRRSMRDCHGGERVKVRSEIKVVAGVFG